MNVRLLKLFVSIGVVRLLCTADLVTRLWFCLTKLNFLLRYVGVILLIPLKVIVNFLFDQMICSYCGLC